MNTARPPEIPGFTLVESIGTGGFADVFLYRQHLPARQVAVKVLRESTSKVGRDQFHAEANVMAQLSSHPSIVSIHQADVSADGQAFLVMEYCPPPHIAQRYRKERLPLHEVLDIGVRIASAVETAHRVGILHRDIKPHNILTSPFGAPLLTDFGIAAVAHEDTEASGGMSVPWSPPEVLGEDPPLDVRSDVYALAATVYSLLAGRSPFEVPGGTNDTATLIHRIENKDASRILRADVPESLSRLLERSLSRSLADRPASAMALARGLQEVQIELRLPPTRLEVMDASPEAATTSQEVSDDRTLVRPVQVIVPEEIAEKGTLLRPREVSQVEDRTRAPRRREPSPDTIRHRPAETVGEPEVGPAAGPAEATQQAPSRARVLWGVGVALVLAVAVVAALVFGSEAAPDEPTPGAQPPSSDVVVGGPSTPVELDHRVKEDSVTFTWRNPDPEPGDTFRVRAGESLGELVEEYQGERSNLRMTVSRGGQQCISISVIRSGSVSEPLTECIVVPGRNSAS